MHALRTARTRSLSSSRHLTRPASTLSERLKQRTRDGGHDAASGPSELAGEGANMSKKQRRAAIKQQRALLQRLERMNTAEEIADRLRDHFPGLEAKAPLVPASQVPTPKKKRAKKKKAEVQHAEAAPVVGGGLLEALSVLTHSEGGLSSGPSKRGAWESGWGPDRLAPPDQPASEPRPDPDFARTQPPHILPKFTYTRKIEGFIQPSTDPVLEDVKPPSEHKPIAQLAHNLDRVLFNPGVHWLRDPRSKVYNFTPWLEKIPNVSEFAFERLTGFIRSSRDEDLWSLAKNERRTFAGSTSSLSGLLSHIYFLVSGERNVDTRSLSQAFANEPTTFTPGQRIPASVVYRYNDGVYAIDSDELVKGSAEKNILTWMGTMLENFLTKTSEEFETLLRANPVPPEDVDPRREAYRYAKSGKFVMRSQLDCYDHRLPGTGVFDIKTRAALPLRLDLMNYEENSGYLIRKSQGMYESFEREYYDLIRSAFLKYSFQVRIGNMDGVIVAYHNTAQIFGLQYVPLEDMDACLLGAPGRGDRVFDKCVKLLETLSSELVTHFPGESVRCTAEKLESDDQLHVWLEPADRTDENAIVQLDISTASFVDGSEVSARRAVSNTEGAWTLHWSIAVSSLSPVEIRRNLEGVRQRQFRAWALPAGLDMEKMERRWNEMNFGGKPSETASIFDPRYFRQPYGAVEVLRRMAREGKMDTDARREAERDMPKVVWGQADEIWPEPESGIAQHADADLAEDVTLADVDEEVAPPVSVELPHADDSLVTQVAAEPATDYDLMDPSIVADFEAALGESERSDATTLLHEETPSIFDSPAATMDGTESALLAAAEAHIASLRVSGDSTLRDIDTSDPPPIVGMEAELFAAVNAHLASLQQEPLTNDVAEPPSVSESPSQTDSSTSSTSTDNSSHN